MSAVAKAAKEQDCQRVHGCQAAADLQQDLDADAARRGHDLGAVADERDERLQHALREVVELAAQLLAQVPATCDVRERVKMLKQ